MDPRTVAPEHADLRGPARRSRRRRACRHPATRGAGHRRLPGRRVRPARPVPRRPRRDDGVPRGQAARGGHGADVPRGHAVRRRRQRRDLVGRRGVGRGEGCVAGRRDRRWPVRHPRGDPPVAGGPSLHDRREGRGSGWYLVGEPVPGCAGRRRKSSLLLRVRAVASLDRVLLPAARAARLLRRACSTSTSSLRTAASAPR